MKTYLIAALICVLAIFTTSACRQKSASPESKEPVKVSDSPQETEQARFLRHKAKAEQGDAESQSTLGFYYAKGQGVEKDYAEAVKWYRKAAEQGHAGAQHSLGVRYEVGQGVVQDDVEAVKWYRKAAEQNHTDAQYNLGFCYENGQGIAKDSVEAYAWYNLSARKFESAVSSRDSLEKAMSPEQVITAQKRAKELRSQIEAKLQSGSK